MVHNIIVYHIDLIVVYEVSVCFVHDDVLINYLIIIRVTSSVKIVISMNFNFNLLALL